MNGKGSSKSWLRRGKMWGRSYCLLIKGGLGKRRSVATDRNTKERKRKEKAGGDLLKEQKKSRFI